MNERITEEIVRKRLRVRNGRHKLEEQKSSNRSITNLLRNASKKGTGPGKPEFIVTFDGYLGFVLIVECKADPKDHERPKGKGKPNPERYAVDGVLHYARHLSKGLDVLAIAVSGQDETTLKVSHCMWEKGQPSHRNTALGTSLLRAKDYFEAYKRWFEKQRQGGDEEEFGRAIRDMNQTLQDEQVPARDRSLLISSILMALRRSTFKKSYALSRNTEDLRRILYQETVAGLEDLNLPRGRVKILKSVIDFITILDISHKVLSDIISTVEHSVFSYSTKHGHMDALGQMYVEFLRYANDQTSLGIVLTPRHITDLFCDLAQVNKNSVVFDNCAGTGGFLISAMQKMVQDATGDSRKISRIRSQQLSGIEAQPNVYALAVSNMLMHQDGHTNIVYGDCFKRASSRGLSHLPPPNIGFLNPPFREVKRSQSPDSEHARRWEMEFVLNNLSRLQPGGICVALVPMSCVSAEKRQPRLWRERLLEKHTLDAVFSLPDELFYNSKVSVVTCAMVIRAHHPHDPKQETFFGYCKDDGFRKVKNQGRTDADERWEGIKAQWLDAYRNRRTVKGLSVTRSVTATDEWCAEAYMETDYSTLTEEDFLHSIRSHVAFQLVHKKRGG